MTPSVDILARTLLGEAEVNDIADAKAIASVVMNRVRHRRWPNEVPGVCLQKLQFSCWNPNDPSRKRIVAAKRGEPWFNKCIEIAEAYAEGGAPDITHGATHYFATWIKAPKWAKGKVPCFRTPWGKYTHLFFNDIDTPAPAVAAKIEQKRADLDAVTPLSRDAVIQGSQVATGGVVATGALESIQEATDVLSPLSYYLEWVQWIVIGLTLAGLAYTIYSRYKDRKAGHV